MTTATLTDAKVGDGATYCGYSDCQAGTIIARTERSITWQADTATLLNPVGSDEPDALQFSAGGFFGHTSGTQRWAHKRNPNGTIRKFTLRKDGRWVQTGSTGRSGATLVAGRSHYYDYNF